MTDTELVNGSFELPEIPAKSYRLLNQRDVPGWDTTATDDKIELWSTGFGGVTAPEGNQFAELNATQPSELYQVVATAPGETLTWSLLHRARRRYRELLVEEIAETIDLDSDPTAAETELLELRESLSA